MVVVVAALIEKDNKYLIAKRIYGNFEVIGKWEFPGGKVEPFEDEMKAIEREIWEEFDVKVKAARYITNSIYEYSNRTVDLRLYECKYISGNFKLNDHSEYKFVSKEELLSYDFCPADVKLMEYISKNM